jgi:prepilin-type N-terminal cleavage/methylation domain-containing protein
MPRARKAGFTLVELLVAVAIGALVALATSELVSTALTARALALRRSSAAQEARFAIERMLRATESSPLLLIPQMDRSWTGHDESVRSPGLLALRLDDRLDRDLDGVADADNDRDGRVDEDWPADVTNDGRPGIRGVDDNGDGFTDFSLGGSADDDESGLWPANTDAVDGIDNDGDGQIDTDPPADLNGDGTPGRAGVDDDGDGMIDGGADDDDDEDGASNEDWLDVALYRLNGTQLLERLPNLGATAGDQYTERIIAANVTSFAVARLPRGARTHDLVSIALTIGAGDEAVTVGTLVRVGGRR